ELLDYIKAYQLLKKYDIRSVKSDYVNSADDAVKFAAGEPIVLKALSQKALHKSKSGLIELNLISDKEIRSAYNQLEKKAARFRPFKILAQHMVKNGLEIIIGGKTDPQFGK